MSHRKTLSRLALAALAAGALTAPAAVAAPIMKSGGPAIPAYVSQDLRSPDAKGAPIDAYVAQDLRSPDAADPPVVKSAGPFPGPPTYPTYHAPIANPGPAAVAGNADADGTDLLVPGLVLAAAGSLLAGGLVVVRMRVRSQVAG